MELTRDFKDFLKLLNVNKVKYLLVGGYSVIYYGYPRFTGDIDFWVGTDDENAVKVKKTLDDFGYYNENVTVEDFKTPDLIIQIGLPPYRIDVITSVEGLNFNDCYERRLKDAIEGENLYIINIEDLKVNKKAVGRYKDLDDLEKLENKK